MRRPVFFGALGVSVAMLVVSVAFRKDAERLFNGVLHGIASNFGGFFAYSVVGLLGFCVWLALGPYGHVRLGKDGEQPEFTTFGWLSMLFSAGMGIGLVFFSVAEPMMHFTAPPLAEARSDASAQSAMELTFFHWGLHAWAVYTVMGAVLAYFCFRRGRPLLIRSAFEPWFGERVQGWVGDVIDTLAVVSTLFGLATSLGLGAMQIDAGLHHVGLADLSMPVQVGIIVTVTAFATLSLVLGLDRGVRRLSELNMVLATALLVFVLVLGPTQHLVGSFMRNVGGYAWGFLQRSFVLDSLGPPEWRSNWTIFYWAWWIAWAPFVGTFIARVSRGRTLREYVAGVLLVPTALTFVWLTVFGETALWLERSGEAPIAAAVSRDNSLAIYAVLEALPLSGWSAALTIVVVTVFFISSSDSGSLVVDTLTSGGMQHPPVWQKVFWAQMEGLVAAVLLIAGGLRALQAAAVATGLPFCALLILMTLGFARALRTHERPRGAASPPRP